jgi:hypothetical protein
MYWRLGSAGGIASLVELCGRRSEAGLENGLPRRGELRRSTTGEERYGRRIEAGSIVLIRCAFERGRVSRGVDMWFSIVDS